MWKDIKMWKENGPLKIGEKNRKNTIFWQCASIVEVIQIISSESGHIQCGSTLAVSAGVLQTESSRQKTSSVYTKCTVAITFEPLNQF